MPTMVRYGLKIFIALALSACAAMQPRDPVQVTVAGLESLPAEGLEVRMLVKLRVQNPNDVPIEYNGVFVKLDVLDQSFATGVSDERGSVPRFGESVISVPITVSMLRIAAQGIGLLGGGSRDKVTYSLEGKLGGSGFTSTRFQAQGQLTLPGTSAPRRRRRGVTKNRRAYRPSSRTACLVSAYR
jgi:LEA14-like dessication related protein